MTSTTFSSTSLSTTGLALLILGAMAISANANPAQPGASAAAAPSTTARTDSTPDIGWVGLTAVSSDGRTLGTVTKLLAAPQDGKATQLLVRAPFDQQAFSIPAGLAERRGNIVSINAKADQLGTRRSS